MPRRFAPRNDMLKLAAWPHKTRALPVYCRKASLHPQPRPRPLRTLRAPRPCTRRNASVFCMSLRASALHPQKRCRLLHVIANQCMGAPQRGTLCGERSHKGALPCSGLWPELGMADFGATRCGNPFSPQGNLASWQYLWQIRGTFPISRSRLNWRYRSRSKTSRTPPAPAAPDTKSG